MSETAATRVAIVMGSSSDWPVMKGAADALDELGVGYEKGVVSAHRMPSDMAEFAAGAAGRGIRVILAGAGGAAHLPGMIAAHTSVPVVGVPVPIGHLQGVDALLSIAQMPKGVPVATVAIGGAYNAGVLAAEILAHGGASPDEALQARLTAFKQSLREKARAMRL